MIIPPHCPDDGISLGCVEFLRQKYQQPHFDRSGFPFWQSDEAPQTIPSKQIIDKTAELLAQGKIVGWYQGHGEIGPRALGNRSILMDPSIKGGKDIINNKVKHREEYRPFGASVLLKSTNDIFECEYDSPFMLYNYKCRDEKRFNSIVHVDGTCRIQTVAPTKEFEVYYELITKFQDKTGIPMLLNTSLNVNGKPIAGTIDDAKSLYDTTELDVLVVGNDLIIK
jgi:carbamoyltransferase